MDKEKTGKLIKEMRVQKGLTQNQLAEVLGVSNKAVSRWETGNSFPDIVLLDVLAEALGVKIEELVLGERKENVADSQALAQIVEVAKEQEIRGIRKIIKIALNILLSGIILAVLMLLFGTISSATGFMALEEVVDLDHARTNFAWDVMFGGFFLWFFGFPFAGMSVAGLVLNNTKRKTKKVRIFWIVFACLSFLWLLVNFIWIRMPFKMMESV